MMPLTLATVGEENMIKKVGGKPEVRAHLEDLALYRAPALPSFQPLAGISL